VGRLLFGATLYISLIADEGRKEVRGHRRMAAGVCQRCAEKVGVDWWVSSERVWQTTESTNDSSALSVGQSVRRSRTAVLIASACLHADAANQTAISYAGPTRLWPDRSVPQADPWALKLGCHADSAKCRISSDFYSCWRSKNVLWRPWRIFGFD